ncbi:hypothetical protein QYE76_070352 [Lolium multiflorum]|uniref:Leucine-rich repeat-containing N-terminal plant-type domain-containing protein n=1 Tax=Lolium multiflorum TaxID=4521 RepID=A0AAD8WFS8_LOLMU|nr:hypothetical protein QYE76_070352 [Lolium multiflorum]
MPAPVVTALLSFLADVGFPQRLAESWAWNDPCKDWLGVSCYQGKVTLLNLTRYGLNGSVSASLGTLSALSDVRLNDDNLTGLESGPVQLNCVMFGEMPSLLEQNYLVSLYRHV